MAVRKVSAPLPQEEVLLYITVWVSSLGCAVYSVYRASQDYASTLSKYDLVDGWWFLDRKQDGSNFEWSFWYGWFWRVWPWLVGHLVIGQITAHQRHLFAWRGWILALYGQLTVLYVMGPCCLLVFLSHVALVHAAALTGRTWCVWLTCLSLLATLNHQPCTDLLKWCSGEEQNDYYFFLFTLAMGNLRYTGSSLELCWTQRVTHRDAVNETYSVMNILLYNFYIPLFFTGPILTCDEFLRQFHAPQLAWSRRRVSEVLKGVTQVVFWTLFLQLILHYLYFNALQHDYRLMQSLPLWAVAGIGYCHGQFFMVKYVVMFGATRTLALLDQLDAPRQPRCIARVYLYSDMWKYFDRGLYSFMKKYIYIPVGGSRHGLLRQCLASLCCFLFVFYWHGAELYLFYWALANFVGVALETLASHVTALPSVHKLEVRWLSPASGRRLRALCAVPMLAGSCIAIFSFFGGRHIGYLFYRRLFVEGGPVAIVTVVMALYCCVQTAKEIERWEQKRAKEH